MLKAFLDIKEPTWKGNIKNPSANIAERLTTITFANKSALSAGLELVDFVSYTIFAKINRKVSKFKKINLLSSVKSIELKTDKNSWVNIDNNLVRRFL